ncbi:MAG: hypothetical protein AB1925_02995 [Actinomycetota bacterium]
MTVYEVLTVALIIALATLAALAIYLGLMNWIGALYMVRCSACHHLAFSSRRDPRASCPHCEHPSLLHPIYAARHRDAPVHVLDDRLRF